VVLVTLRGCHLLDGLVACDSVEARVEIVRDSGGGFMRGDCAHHRHWRLDLFIFILVIIC
jgi:hypothetical protein